MSTIGGNKIATTGSEHMCPGPTPATSLCPPPAPTGPVPTPFAYISKSASATNTRNKLLVADDPVLVIGSEMSIEKPGNTPSGPPGLGDVVTHVVNAKTGVFTGQASVKVSGKDVAATTDRCRMNMPRGNGQVAQAIGTLVMGDTLLSADNKEAHAASDVVILDPISVSSGTVVDTNVDLALDGFIPVIFERLYSTARLRDHTPFGRGGWTHGYHQYLELAAGEVALRDADGRTITFPRRDPGQVAFCRARRLELTVDRRGGASLRSLDTRLTRRFAPMGGRAYLTEIADATGMAVRFEYEAERLVRIVDTAGRRVELGHDRHGHIVRLAVFARSSEPLYVVDYAYGDDGELVGATDATGHAETYAYDGRRRLLVKRLPNGLGFHYRYDDESGRCVRAWGDGGIHAGVLEYDVDKGITRLTGTPRPEIYAWRQDGAVVRHASADGAIDAEFVYDDDRHLLEQKNAAGQVVRYEYDARANLVALTEPAGEVTRYEYCDDLLVRRTLGALVTEYEYNPRGQLTRVTYPGGAHLAIDYDHLGRPASIFGPSGFRQGFEYDDDHNLVAVRSARGGVQRRGYDALGRVISLTDALGREVRRELDALGRVTRMRRPDGGTIGFEYDVLGRLVGRIEPDGRQQRITWEGLGSAVAMELGDGGDDDLVWELSYDALERLHGVRNPAGEEHAYRYDRAGAICEMRTYDGRVVRSQRDKARMPLRVDLPDGEWLAYRHDPGGQLVAEESPHGDLRVTRTALPEGGSLVELVLHDPAGAQRFAFRHDRLDRVDREEQGDHAIEYAYDRENLCVERRLSSGEVTRYGRDEVGLVAWLEHEGYRVRIERGLDDVVARRVFAVPGIEERRELDASGRLARQWVGSATTTLVDRRYHYDRGDYLVAIEDARWGRQHFGYDKARRLTRAASAAATETFAYDANGSLTAGAERWDILPGNLVVETPRAAYEYDAGSRRTRERRHDGSVIELHWDCRARLREVTLPDKTRVLYAYDAFGRRVRKEVAPPPDIAPDRPLPEALPPRRVTEYVWESERVTMEIDSERGTRHYLYEPATMLPLLIVDEPKNGPARRYAVITNHVGTVTELIDEDGRLAWSGLRSAWGEVLREERAEGAIRPPFRLLGQYHDEETDLCYVRHRYFDTRLARFLSPDPLEILGGANLMAFNGAPTMHVDPLGLRCIIFGDPAKDGAMNHILATVVPGPGAFFVGIHGSSTGFSYTNSHGADVSMSAQQVIDRIRISDHYPGGHTPMFLYSCNTGRTPFAVGQQVSQAFGNTVFAPNDLFWTPSGVIAPATINGPRDEYLAPAPGTQLQPDMSRQGQMNGWSNGTAHPANRYRPNYEHTPPDYAGP